MRYIGRKKEKPKGALLVLAIIVTLINSGYYRSTVTDSYIPLITLIALTAYLVLTHYDKLSSIKGTFLPFMLINAIVFSVLANLGISNLLSGIRVGATMLCAYILTRIFDVKDFSRVFAIAIKTLIVITLVFEIVLAIGFKKIPTINGYYDLFIVTSTVGANRAFSIFWEPGVFASMIVISIIFEYYIAANKVTLVGLLIYILGFFLSSSTAGFLLMAIVLLGLLWRKKDGSKQDGSIQYRTLRKKPN